MLLRHPDIRQAALIALPDANLGERSVAFIVAATPLKPVALRRHLSALGLASYKLPDQFRSLDALPLTPIGKTDKRRLRALLADSESIEGALT